MLPQYEWIVKRKFKKKGGRITRTPTDSRRTGNGRGRGTGKRNNDGRGAESSKCGSIFFFESKIFFADKKILIQDKKINPHFLLSLIGAPMALNQKQVFDSCSRSEHRPARARTAAVGRKISFPSLPDRTPPAAQRHPLPVCLGRARALPLRGRGTR
jgi:hypothetical protein